MSLTYEPASEPLHISDFRARLAYRWQESTLDRSPRSTVPPVAVQTCRVVQRYLANKKPLPLGPYSSLCHTVVLGGGAVSYERGFPALFSQRLWFYRTPSEVMRALQISYQRGFTTTWNCQVATEPHPVGDFRPREKSFYPRNKLIFLQKKPTGEGVRAILWTDRSSTFPSSDSG